LGKIIVKVRILKRVVAFFSICLLICSLTVPVFAVQVHTYAESYRSQTSNNNGFCVGATLPILGSNWSAGVENKINFEFWFNINNSSSQWVEMGYHDGYSFKSDGSPNTSSRYTGLFTAKAGNGTWSLTTYPSRNWAANQSRTWHNQLRQSGGVWYSDMVDGSTVVISYSNSGPSSQGSTDAGLEFGNSNGAWQGISVPSSMWGVGSYINGSWTGWYTLGGVTNYNNAATVTASYNSTSNEIDFN
jgi:hypothetical protein